MTSISFTSGEILDIISSLEESESRAYYAKNDPQLAAYYMNMAQQFQKVYDRLQDMIPEERVANLVLAA
jgi:hypothetical protein